MRESVIRFVGLLVMCCAVGQLAFSGNAQWRNYTAMQQGRDAVQYGNMVYVVTSGGMFGYTDNGETIETFTTSEGLSAIDLTAVTVDMQGTLWIGATGGHIDGYNPLENSWRKVTDITRTDFPQRDISTLSTRGDTLYVGTSFGVSIYSISRNEFNDSYIKFGQFQTQTPVTALAYDDRYIWIGTTVGVARGEVNDPLLAAPDRWQTFSIVNNIPNGHINDIVIHDGVPFAATPGGIVWYDGNAWNRIDGFANIDVRALAVVNASLYAATPRDVYKVDRQGIIERYGTTLPSEIHALSKSEENLIVVMRSGGIAHLVENNWQTIAPEGPETNILTHVYVDRSSNVWIATGSGASGRGFYRYGPAETVGEKWKSFTFQQYEQLRSNAYYRVSGTSDGTVWASNWGRGITKVHPDGSIRNFYVNDGLVGITQDPNFIVTGKAAEDRNGNVWFTLYNMSEGRPLAMISPESFSLSLFRNQRNPNATLLGDVIIDRFDTVWMISSFSTTLGGQDGLFYFNANESIGTHIEGWGIVTTAHGLPSNSINAIAEDNRGEIWVGTNQGLAVISNPREPQSSVRDIFTLMDQVINAIEIDPLNRKWVGTQEGVFLLSPDGTQLLEHYNMRNTDNKLLANEILSIAFDDNTGIVYFGSDRGISSVQTVAVAPTPSFIDLFVSPNPYRIPAEHLMKIDGLVRNAKIKILSVDGRLVRSFDSPGGRIAFWDGRDATGNQVASGIYIIVGVSEDGTEVGKSKVTVIRR
jgi:ligand-binding sensor domain-containing protein